MGCRERFTAACTAALLGLAPHAHADPTFGGLDMDLPSTPYFSLQDWEASVAMNPANRAFVTPADDLQAALDAAFARAWAGSGLQDVVLSRDEPYPLSATLTVPPLVRLRGMQGDAAYPNQVLEAAPGFAADTPMVSMQAYAALDQLHIDGRNVAWRIVETQSGSQSIHIANSRLERTHHALGPAAAPLEVGVPLSRTHIIDLGANTSRVLIRGNTLEYAGLEPVVGRANDPYAWGALSAGIAAHRATDVIIYANVIHEIATAGVDLWRTERVVVADNWIVDVSRASDWYPGTAARTIPLGDGITGYNNATVSGPNTEGERHWIIDGNWIVNSGNNGIHVSGMTMWVANNALQRIQQSDLFLGGTISPGTLYDCNEGVRLPNNRVFDQPAIADYQPLYTATPTPPEFNVLNVLVRHWIDAGPPLAELVLASDFDSTRAAPWVTPAPTFDAGQSACDHRMSDP